MDPKSCPSDRFKFVQIIFFFLGLGTLLPWNFFITAIPYFVGRLNAVPGNIPPGNVTTGNASTLTSGREQAGDQWHFSNWMTLLSMLPLLLFTCLNSILYPRIPERVRIAGSLCGIFLLFVVTVLLVVVPVHPAMFFGITMTIIWFINSFGAVLQGSLFGLVGILPAKYSSIFMSGQGVAGMFAALASILAKISRADESTIALGYFITPCVVILITIIFYCTLPYLEFAKYYFNKDHPNPCYELESKTDLLMHKEKNGMVPANGKQALVHLQEEDIQDDQSEMGFSVIKVFRKIWKLAISICLIFIVTLSVFPAVTADVSSHTKHGQWKEYFIPVSCFLLFNIMDGERMCRAGLSVGVVLYLNGVSQSFNMTDYTEEQRNELEALESIYPDSFTVVSENPTSFTITVTSDTGEDEETVEATIQFTYVEQYPDEPPIFEVIGQENIQKSDVADIITLLNEQIQENIGMVMIFTLVTAVQEKLNEVVDQIKFRKEEEKLLKEKEAEEVEKAVFHGTPVTIENFLSWKAKFDAELAEIRRKRQREEEQAGKVKLTGKQLFETDHNLDTSDIQFLEEGNNVEVDESLFQDMDDLELDDDDDEDPDYNPDLGSEED